MSNLRSDMNELAEQLLLQGKDRLPWKFDKRNLRHLTRGHGLLRYPDGTFSLSEDSMGEAISWWRVLLREPQLGQQARAKFLELIRLGKRWQEPAPIIPGMMFGDLTQKQYAVLWDLVIRRELPMWRHGPDVPKRERASWGQLEKLGYVTIEFKGETMVIAPTPKATALVTELGSPSANHRQASYDFRA